MKPVGTVHHPAPVHVHVCAPPGWWWRRRLHIRNGSVFTCGDCGKAWCWKYSYYSGAFCWIRFR